MPTVPSKLPVSDEPAANLDVLAYMAAMFGMLQLLCGKVDALARDLSGKVKSHLTVDEIAELTGRSPYTVRRWITTGVIEATRIDAGGPRGRLLIARSELDKLVDAGKGGSLRGIDAR